ncbi:MAG: NUDIX hydrolase [Armatimonadota bacterium]
MTTKPFALSMKIIVKNAEGRCLLLKRSVDSKNNPGKWDFPGGKIDPGETFDQALLREVSEETGLSIRIDGLVGSTQSESPTNRIVYLILEGSVESGDVRLSPEHQDMLWVDPSELAKADICRQFASLAAAYADRSDSNG